MPPSVISKNIGKRVVRCPLASANFLEAISSAIIESASPKKMAATAINLNTVVIYSSAYRKEKASGSEPLRHLPRAALFVFYRRQRYYFGMSLPKQIVVGTRGSALALKQVDIVAAVLRAVYPSLSIEVRIIQTYGDKNQNPIPLDTVGKGWFTEEIETALRSGEIHLAVHSLKDMADEISPGLRIGAYLAREDARDVLVTKYGESLEHLKQGAVIGTDSSRRQIQMKALRPDMVMKSLRGNVPTRLQKLESGPYDAIILAAAGLIRLGLEERITRYFEPHEMVSAPGQGILAIQTKEDSTELGELLTAVNDKEVAHIARVERSFSKVVGGGCKSPTGAYAFREGDRCTLIGMKADSERSIMRETLSAPWGSSEALGEVLAKRLLGY